jgi:hypothetical protein
LGPAPLWGRLVFLLYAPRRVDRGACGVLVEAMPWATGKSSMTTAYMNGDHLRLGLGVFV